MTVEELDEVLALCRQKKAFESGSPGMVVSDADLFVLLKMHIVAGISVSDLREAVERAKAAFVARVKRKRDERMAQLSGDPAGQEFEGGIYEKRIAALEMS